MLGLISPGSTEADVKLGGNIYLNIYFCLLYTSDAADE